MGATRRIALVGQLGTGKSYVANKLSEVIDAERISFGQEVYRVAEDAIGRKIDKSRPEDRKLLTDVGTHWGRNGENVDPALEAGLSTVWHHSHGYEGMWVDALGRRIASRPISIGYVLDDLRFPNELEFLMKNGFLVYLLLCSVQTRELRLDDRGDPYATTVDGHPSEAFATWLTHLSLPKVIVPSLWNDQKNGSEHDGDRLLMRIEKLYDTLLTSSEDDMLSMSSNHATWSKALKEFQR